MRKNNARARRTAPGRRRRLVSVVSALAVGVTLAPLSALSTVAVAPASAAVGQGFNLNPSDLRFILRQIKLAEHHASVYSASDPCAGLTGSGEYQIPTDAQGEELPWGLRTVDGTCNNLVPGKAKYGAADQVFPRSADAEYRGAEAVPPQMPPGNTIAPGGTTSYARPGTVYDSQPRKISNMIVDQTTTNPAAVEVAGPGATPDPDSGTLFIQNEAPDVGLSAPYNSWFTLFGQFFDHGLDLVSKSGGTVYMPLATDDPLYREGARTNFMAVTRSTGSPGEATNLTATLVDQSQTYGSLPAQQVFLREYVLDAGQRPVSSGLMLRGRLANGTRDGMATWATVKEQSRNLLGIELDDRDVLNIPLLATDPYGRFLPGPARGLPQLVTATGLVEGNLAAPVDATQAQGTGHAFLDDIAHTAVPQADTNHDGTPEWLAKDVDTVAGPDDGLPGTYDDELLDEHFVAGDGRVNENIGLTAVHEVFHSEHNRLAADPATGETGGAGIKDVLATMPEEEVNRDWRLPTGEWNGERIFQAARFVTEMEYQHLAFEEFARKVQPMVNLFGEGGGGYDTSVNPAIRAEFAHAVYRFGHSMLTETVARREKNGTRTNIPLLEAFLNPLAYDDAGTVEPEAASGRIIRGMSRQAGNEIDEFVTDALRNKLLGLPLDLPAINMARAREAGVPRLNDARRDFFEASNNPALAPYESWTDFGFNLKHRESLVNFIAVYGHHPSITGSRTARREAATRLIVNNSADLATPADADDFMTSQGTWATSNTGLDDVDLWVGGLAEKRMVFGGLLGPTFNYVFEMQMEDLQFGDRFYYLSRTAGLNLLTQLEGNSFAELISRNTDVEGLPADSFSRPDYVLDVGALLEDPTGVKDDELTLDYDEGNRLTEPGSDLSRVNRTTDPDMLRYSGPAHVVFNGTAGTDRVHSSEGDDTIRGNDGDDWMEGGDGADNLIGGLGDDIMNDLFGDDVLKGGDGDDAISSGQGFAGDLNQGGRGQDFVWGGNDDTESFAGPGNDMVWAGDGMDTVFGDDGDDWIEGGKGPFNLLQGDNGAPFQNDPNAPGHDVLDGDGGEQDFDAEGGDDIMLLGPGIQRSEGMLGFDWTTHQDDPQAGKSDMDFTGALPPSVDALRDRFDLVEGLSGWNHDDVLRGDSRNADDTVAPGDEPIGLGHALDEAGIDRIGGLQELLGAGATSFASGNIILGGNGSDVIEGRGGDDVIDGDKWLHVSLEVRDDAGNVVRTVDTMKEIKTDVFNGTIDPGNVRIVRRVEDGDGSGTDQAQFSDIRANYICSDADGPLTRCPLEWDGTPITVEHSATGDGTDRLTNVEQLRFSDSVPPAAPTNVTAVSERTAVRVTFTPPTDVVTGFEVQALDDTGTVVDSQALADDEVTALFTDLPLGRALTFRVRGVNDSGVGDWSVATTAVTATAVAPDAPGGVPAVTLDGTRATVRWQAPADDGGVPVTSYDVRVVGLDGSELRVVPVVSSTLMTTIDGLAAGDEVSFQVRAVNEVGPGPWSADSGLVTPAFAPGAPGIRRAWARNRAAIVRWREPAEDGGADITGYRVQVLRGTRRVGVLRAAPGTARSLRVTGLRNGRWYRFRVLAMNDQGAGRWSRRSNAVRPHR